MSKTLDMLNVLAANGKVIVGRSSLAEKQFTAELVLLRKLDTEVSVIADTPKEAIRALYNKVMFGDSP